MRKKNATAPAAQCFCLVDEPEELVARDGRYFVVSQHMPKSLELFVAWLYYRGLQFVYDLFMAKQGGQANGG